MSKRKDVYTFIKEHNHINYCEAVIDKDGLIEYVSPNHVKTLIRSTGETEEEIYDKMPIWESPIHWLVEYTGYISVWSNGCLFPSSITKEQEYTLKQLVLNRLTVSNRF